MRVTSIQLEATAGDRAEVLARAVGLLDQAAGSDLVLLPELWPCGYFSFERYICESEPVDGPTVRALAARARALGAYVFTGSFVERASEGYFNTSLLLDRDGAVVARYRKMHLFGYRSEEPRLLSPGDEVVVAETPWGVCGLSICYDLRFPELYRRMVDRGAEIFLLASAWPAERVETWTLLNRARALENQAFLFSCNGAGTSGGVRLGGHSLFVDPSGKVLAEAGEGQERLSLDVDPESVRRFRRDFTALRDRRLRC